MSYGALWEIMRAGAALILPVTLLRSAVVEGDVRMLAVGTDRKLAGHRGAAAPGRIRQRSIARADAGLTR